MLVCFLSSYYTQIVSILRTNQQLYPVYNYSYLYSCARLFTRYYYFTRVSRSAYNARGCESIISNNNKNRVLIFSIVYICTCCNYCMCRKVFFYINYIFQRYFRFIRFFREKNLYQKSLIYTPKFQMT